MNTLGLKFIVILMLLAFMAGTFPCDPDCHDTNESPDCVCLVHCTTAVLTTSIFTPKNHSEADLLSASPTSPSFSLLSRIFRPPIA